jgi:hypothetical protein
MKNIDNSKKLYTLIPLEEFKAILSPDDRDEKLTRFCLTIATHAVEQYCHRRLVVKGHFEDLPFFGDFTIPLIHYPVQKICAVYLKMSNEQLAMSNGKEQRGMSKEERKMFGLSNWELVEPDFFSFLPECGDAIDTPFSLILSPAL